MVTDVVVEMVEVVEVVEGVWVMVEMGVEMGVEMVMPCFPALAFGLVFYDVVFEYIEWLVTSFYQVAFFLSRGVFLVKNSSELPVTLTLKF